MPPDAIDTLEDIQEAIAYIVEDVQSTSFDVFLDNRHIRQSVMYNFLVIGEAIGRLDRHHPNLFQRISDARDIVDFRNAIIHGYDLISYPKVWRICREYLPVLEREVDTLLAELEP